MSSSLISTWQPIHTDTSHAAKSETSFQHFRFLGLLCSGVQSQSTFPVLYRRCARHVFCRAHGTEPPHAMDCFQVSERDVSSLDTH